jgi:RNA polymerase sigma factor (TIGR02999 family)
VASFCSRQRFFEQRRINQNVASYVEVAHTEITQLLEEWGRGNGEALGQLMPIVYAELNKLARYYLKFERSGHTFQTAALVHEAYLRLLGHNNVQWESRRHFFAVVSRIIRHVLVDHARRRRAGKREHESAPLEEALTISARHDIDVVRLNEALEVLGEMDADLLRVVELRFFAGLSVEDTAELMDTSPATVKRRWSTARLWLYKQMQGGGV